MDVSTVDLAYRDLEKLQSFELVDPTIVGQRPYTRLDFARFARQARSRLDASHTEYVRGIVERLELRFASELELPTEYRGIEQASMQLTGARSPPRLVREHLGAVDAVINPLLGYRQGRRLVDGITGGLETVHWARFSDRAAVYARPRVQLSEARGTAENVNDVTVQEAYGKLAFGMFSLQAGRSNMVWGQGRHAGMILSGNARGFDMVKLTNEPWVPPWIFRYLGPTKGTVFLATTVADRDRHFVNSYVFGYKVSFQPTTWLELAASFIVEAGGEGAPEASFGDRLTDHLFIVDLFITDADVFFSNKIGGGEFRLWVPGARGLQLYGEVVFDDVSPSDFGKWLGQDAGYLAGVYAPRIDREGRLDFSFEYQNTGVRYFRHSQFRTGFTFDQFLWGSILGPEGQAGYVELNWDATGTDVLSLHGAYEGRSHDVYETTGRDRTAKTQSLPQERRYRVVGSWTHRPLQETFLVKATVGYERVNTFDFAVGSNHGSVIGQIEFQLRF